MCSFVFPVQLHVPAWTAPESDTVIFLPWKTLYFTAKNATYSWVKKKMQKKQCYKIKKQPPKKPLETIEILT